MILHWLAAQQAEAAQYLVEYGHLLPDREDVRHLLQCYFLVPVAVALLQPRMDVAMALALHGRPDSLLDWMLASQPSAEEGLLVTSRMPQHFYGPHNELMSQLSSYVATFALRQIDQWVHVARKHSQSIAMSADVAPGMLTWCMRQSKAYVFLVCLLQQVHHRLVCNLVVPEHAREVHSTILVLKEAMSSTVTAHMRASCTRGGHVGRPGARGAHRGRCFRRT